MPEVFEPVPFARRLMALLYDGLGILTLAYFASFIPVVMEGRIIEPGNPFMRLYLALIMFGYFGLCWTRGRTLGMQVWKLVMVAGAGDRRPTWREAVLRFIGAGLSFLLGLAAYQALKRTGMPHAEFGLLLAFAGYVPALFDAEHLAWHDRWSGTRLLRRRVTASGG